MEFAHRPVLLEETVTALNCRPGSLIVDCTLGGAGHAREILARTQPGGRLVGIDQDQAAITTAGERLAEYKDSITLVHGNFARLSQILTGLGIKAVDGILFDLGVSSYQLDAAERGFSYRSDAPLDMRMDPSVPISARDLVNDLGERELERIIVDYGEERWARRIAAFILAARRKEAINTTGQLVEIIKQAIPAGARQEGPHPARRTFQALRIAVNDELGVLERSLRQAVDSLKPGGRICAISFHSLEDRIVKQMFREYTGGCTCPPGLPVCVCNRPQMLRVLTRRPVLPSPDEIEANPRARSARLRAAERLPEGSKSREVGIK